MRIPLERPALPALVPLGWPTLSIAIFGASEAALAEAFIAGWRAEDAGPLARLDVALRHAPGADVGESRIDAHPDALAEALATARGRAVAPLLGVGAAFVAGVAASLTVYSGSIDALSKLPDPLRVVARRASLILDEPRLVVARELGRRLARLEAPPPRP